MLERLKRLKPWCLPALALVLAVVAGVILFGKMRRDVWVYYTDGEGLRTDAHDPRARPVLWQDPEPQQFEEQANPSPGTLEAAFSADGTTMILVRWGDSADMYLSNWDGRTWSPPQPLESINTDANERGPALSRDGRSLYFASDRKGGLGGYDLYVAHLEGEAWTQPKSLSPLVNTAANELGPALSAAGQQLYFSSDRNGQGDDIFVSIITGAEQLEFGEAREVDDLNSTAADVQAALTSRGDHVFLASDRDRDNRAGFKVYISRVVDGEPLPPEAVDLYIDDGDVTDPAVRMDGFDLLFSSGKSQAEDGYQLYRSTTREVVGYTDVSRWEDFKILMGNIAWWIVLAIAALIALIYILEKWRDMTTLFHKCLAGSAVLHLLALMIAMLWLIAQKIEEKDQSKQEVSISIDALAEEELAMESAPEEAQLTDTSNNLESEKVEAEFGAPGFEEQADAQPMLEATQTVKESVLVEAQPKMSEPVEQPATDAADAAEEADLLKDLSATALPEIDAPLLEEADSAKPQEQVADNKSDAFEPEVPVPDTEKAEPAEMQEVVAESQAETGDVTEVNEAPALADAPKDPVLEASAREIPVELPVESQPLESTVLSDLASTLFTDSAETALDEGQAEIAPAPADTAGAEFSPDDAAATLNSAPANRATVADLAAASAADTEAVESSDSGSKSSAIADVAASIGLASAAESLPATDLDAGALGGLPDLALSDPGAPMLEEPEPAASGAPVNPSNDAFTPDNAATSLTTLPARSESPANTALATRADTAAITGGELVAGSPVIDSRPPELLASAPAAAMPTPGDGPARPGSLPEPLLLDPGAPLLEEVSERPPGAPATPGDDQFKPDGAPALATSQAKTSVADGAAIPDKGGADAVENGTLVARSALAESLSPVGIESRLAENLPPSEIEVGLPEVALVDAGAPQLEEGSRPAGASADTSKDQFAPGAAVPNLATTPAAGRAIPDRAVADPAGAAAVAEARRDAVGGGILARAPLVAAGSLPDLSAGNLAAEISVTPPMQSLLPGELEVDVELDLKGMARLLQKQRGKPGIDTIKQMGGSDGTERAIGAAMEWLVKNQEEDGRWDTRKHGSNQGYDSGGTGLALLCFLGWGERHDQACKYQNNVRRALDWLLREQKRDGYLGERPGMMYSHAIATIALCEAYGLTKDRRLKDPAERAIAYTLAAQSKRRGGWRYSPGEDSDTSVTGWQYMALHSARMAGINVPEESFDRARGYLDQMGGGKHGGLYGYQQRGKLSRAMVATGMFCRQLDLVPPSDPMMQESARMLKLHPMKSSKPDLYYVYYATLALYQHQGPIWLAWNERLKEILPQIQNTQGKDSGSWDPSSSMAGDGGRVVSTTLATLSLEVFYRLLPMYGFRNEEAEVPEKKQREE